MNRLYKLPFAFVTAICYLVFGVSGSRAQCTFTPSGIVTNLSCFGANDGAINLSIQSGGGGTGATGYCLPSYTQDACGCPSTWDYIENVSTTGGSTNISNLNSSCNGTLPNNYAFFPAQVVTVNPGASFDIAVQCATVGCSNTFNQGFAVWVDWSNDGDFSDAGEDVWTSGSAGFTLFTG
ncbi:MAG TPA: hypothetical protein VEY71_08610, partial [Chitinophagales bacterium]|nr:hypothetical protein [Chitinophagales bacterium]